jgi:hypothetical protein
MQVIQLKPHAKWLLLSTQLGQAQGTERSLHECLPKPLFLSLLLKHNLATPGTKLPIHRSQYLFRERHFMLLILKWLIITLYSIEKLGISLEASLEAIAL